MKSSEQFRDIAGGMRIMADLLDRVAAAHTLHEEEPDLERSMLKQVAVWDQFQEHAKEAMSRIHAEFPYGAGMAESFLAATGSSIKGYQSKIASLLDELRDGKRRDDDGEQWKKT